MLEIHEQELLEHGIDYADAIDRFDGDGEMYESLVFRYLDDTKFDELKAILDGEDAAEAHRVAHALKGVTGTLSFVVFFQGLSIMCEALYEGDLDTARQLLPDVDAAHTLVTTILHKYQATLP